MSYYGRSSCKEGLRFDRTDYFIDRLIDDLIQDRLTYIGLNSIDEIVNRKWLRNWIKLGSPIEPQSPFYKKQVLLKYAFEDIVKRKKHLVINLKQYM